MKVLCVYYTTLKPEPVIIFLKGNLYICTYPSIFPHKKGRFISMKSPLIKSITVLDFLTFRTAGALAAGWTTAEGSCFSKGIKEAGAGLSILR